MTSPPSWWLTLFRRLYRGGARRLWAAGVDAAELEREGWRLQDDPRGCDALVDFGGLAPGGALPLADGALFMYGAPWQTVQPEAWRAALESRHGATAHLLDSEADCAWLVAFGWHGQRVAPTRRVLMGAHQNALRMFGGGETQLFETLHALRGEGVLADVSLSLRLDAAPYDLLHLFSLYHEDKQARLPAIGKPVVVSTIYWDYAEMHRGTAVLKAIFEQPSAAEVDGMLGAWRSGRLQLPSLDDMRRQPFLAQLTASQGRVLAHARLLLVNAEREADMVRRTWPALDVPIQFVPNAVRPELLLTASAAAFQERFGTQDFVLCAARVEPNKNQLMLIWALRGSGLRVLCAGLETAPFTALCKRWAGPEVTFSGPLSPHMLASAYAAARVHALPSWSETPGLSNLEAAVAGCSLVVGDRGAEQEYLSPYAFVSDAADDLSIRAAVQAAWEQRDAARLEAQREHVLTHYTWCHAAQATAAAYAQVLD